MRHARCWSSARRPARPTDVSAWLQLSRCHGSGAGRFLARALVDPLCGGSRLVSVGPVTANRRVDFVLSRSGGASREVVRAAVDERGRITAVEVWLVSEPAEGRAYRDAPRLLGLLQGTAVMAISQRAEAVVLTNTAGDRVAVAAGDFGTGTGAI